MRPPRLMKTDGREGVTGMMGRIAQQAAEVQHVALLAADGRDHAHGRGLVFTMPMAASSAMRAG